MITPTSESTKADGVRRVTGRWCHTSRSRYPDWAIAITDERGREPELGTDRPRRPEVREDLARVLAGSRALDNVTCAIDIPLAEHGADSFAEVHSPRRSWRDSAEISGKALLGREDRITPLS